jgi:hypothetical protein
MGSGVFENHTHPVVLRNISQNGWIVTRSLEGEHIADSCLIRSRVQVKMLGVCGVEGY